MEKITIDLNTTPKEILDELLSQKTVKRKFLPFNGKVYELEYAESFDEYLKTRRLEKAKQHYHQHAKEKVKAKYLNSRLEAIKAEFGEEAVAQYKSHKRYELKQDEDRKPRLSSYYYTLKARAKQRLAPAPEAAANEPQNAL